MEKEKNFILIYIYSQWIYINFVKQNYFTSRFTKGTLLKTQDTDCT